MMRSNKVDNSERAEYIGMNTAPAAAPHVTIASSAITSNQGENMSSTSLNRGGNVIGGMPRRTSSFAFDRRASSFQRRESSPQATLVPQRTRMSQHLIDAKKTAPSGYGFFGYALIGLSYLLVALTFPISICCCIKIIKEYERAVIFRLGRSSADAKGPGLFFILPCIDNIIIIDLRTITFDVAPQEILTKDSVTITVDAVVYFRIFSPIVSVTNVENAQYSTRLLAATTLRNILGTRTLQEILQDREIIAHHMQELLDGATEYWGVKVERVEVKDVRLPVQMQRAMATEAEATREARAKVVAAEGEQKASLALKNAADTINQSPVALQLRYLQTLTHIAGEKNSTIIFPIPIEFLRALPGALGSNRS